MDRFFFNSYQWVKAHKLWGIFALILCFSALGLYVQSIRFEEDITKLIPINKENEIYQKVLNTVNFADKIVVNISKEPQATTEDLSRAARSLVDSLAPLKPQYIKQIQGVVDEEDIGTTLDFIYRHLPLFLEGKDYDAIKQKLNKDSIVAITEANYKTLISPSGIVSKETILRDPLGLTVRALKNLRENGLSSDFTIENGFVMSQDKNHILLFISPSTASNETKKNTLFVEKLNQITEQLNQTFKGKASISTFGSTLVAVANANQIKTDIKFTVGIALIVLLLILILFYRRFYIPIILFIPTLFGGLLALAVLCLVRQEISAISLGIGSVLLGITIDYSLHILTHIRSNSNIQELYQDITKPILMSSLTTALAFLCLLFLRSQALQDLGLFAAISVMGASSFALLFIPQVYTEKVTANKQQTILDRVAAKPIHKSKGLVALLGILFVTSLFTYHNVGFNKDLASLNYEPKHLKDAEKQLDALMNSRSKSVYLVTYGATDEDALQKNDTVFHRLKELKDQGAILRYNSVGGIVASKALQRKKIRRWEAFWDQKTKDSVAALLVESSTPFGFKKTSFQDFYTHLNAAFKPQEPNMFLALKLIDPHDFISHKEGMHTVSTLVKLDSGKTQTLESAVSDMPNVVTIDRQQTSERFLGHLKTDFNHLIQVSLVVILLLLLLFYRSVSLTLVTALPICLTWLLTIGIMWILDLQFNIFNIIISTFIFGLGIDYSIFVTNGMLHQYRTGESVLNTYKTSIILSVITTIFGIGVLVFAKHPALHSISVISVIGILSALIIAFAIQPLLFKLLIGSHDKRPIPIRHLLHSGISFGYFGIGGVLLSVLSVILIPLIPVSMKKKMPVFHKLVSKFMKSVLYTNPLVAKKVLNPHNETFQKQAIIIANHTSFLDILAIGMLHPKIIFIVNDWVYNSPIFGRAVRLAGFYRVSDGLDKGYEHLRKKIDQGYSIAVFPEGTRAFTHKMKRFHKGAFLLAEQFKLDVLPVLIHGNSEVLPKGTFIIKDGSITIKILERIPAQVPSSGETYKERTKAISKLFKAHFMAIRKEIETETYFHHLLLEEYRYKGNTVYKAVKDTLKKNRTVYYSILKQLEPTAHILHITDGYGELSSLMALDEPARHIKSFITDISKQTIANNTVTANTHYKLYFEPEENLSNLDPEVLILNLQNYRSFLNLGIRLKQPSKCLILLHEGSVFMEYQNLSSGMHLVFEKDILQIYKQI